MEHAHTAIVIPAYNEALTITDVVERTRRYVPWVIVVDDGSTDGTTEHLKDLPVTVLRHAHNCGKAASLWHGMSVAVERGARMVLTMDADGQHRPEEIPRLLAAGRQHSHSIIIAARLENRQAVPKARRFANWMADFWISWAAGHPIRDTQSGFRLYHAELLKQINIAHDRRHSFVFESEILIEAARRAYYTKPVAIESIYASGGRASHYRPAVDTSRIVQMVAWKLLARGLYLPGLFRSLGWLAHPATDAGRHDA